MDSGIKKRIAAIVAAMLVIETVTGGITDVYASSGQDILGQGYAGNTVQDILPGQAETVDMVLPAEQGTEDMAGMTAGQTDTQPAGEAYPGMDYAEGEVIVCVKESSEQPAEGSSDGIMAETASYDLLYNAEELMDVSEAAGEIQIDETAGTGDGYEIPAETAFERDNDARTVLKFIHSDEYSTLELIEMLSARDDVLFAEPNYLHRIEEPVVEGYETAYYTEDAAGDSEAVSFGTDEEADMSSKAAGEEQQEAVWGGLVLEDITGDIPAESAWDGKRDLTPNQYAYGNGPGGMDIPGWNTVSANAKGVVAVIDSGVDYNNPDLKDVMWDEGLNYPELVKLGGGKYGIAPAGSAEFGYSTDDPMDRSGHGTHCAGIIAAAWNGFGVSGAANGAKIMALSTFDHKDSMPDVNIIKCFNYVLTAKKAGVDVVAVNNSWGGSFTSLVFRYIVKELGDEGVVVCFSAGNDNYNVDINTKTAASFGREANEITVGSSDSNGKKSEFSNWGKRQTDVFAPGTEILSTYPAYLGDIYGSLAQTAVDAGGKKIMDDYEKADDLNGTYFTYKKMEEAGEPIISENTVSWSGIGNKTLVIPEISGRTEGVVPVLTFGMRDGNKLPGGEYEVIVKHRADKPNVYLMLQVRTVDGQYVSAGEGGYSASTWSETVFKLPYDADLYNPDMRLCVCPDETSETSYKVFIDEIRLTEEREGTPFALMSGTSMACPAVTGAVAVVAKAFPDDSAAKRAARILAGAKENADIKDLCVTDGIVNIKNSLDESKYTPVIEKVWLDETKKKLNVEGYFFGENYELLLSGNKVPFNIKEYDDDHYVLTADIPEWLKSGELCVSVKNTGNSKTGSRYVSIKRPDDSDTVYYNRIKLPEDKEFGKTYVGAMGAVDGRIVITGNIDDKDTAVTWIYNISANRFERCLKGNDAITPAGGMCAWNKKLVYTDYGTGELRIFDPATGKTIDSALIYGIDQVNPAPVFYLTDSGSLLCFARSSGTDKDPKTDVYEIDTDYLRSVWLCELEGDYTGDAIVGESSDKEIYITTGKADKLAGFKVTGSKGNAKIDKEGIKYYKIDTGNMQLNKETAKGCSVQEGMFLINGCDTEEGLSVWDQSVTADNYFLSFDSVDSENEKVSFTASANRIAPFRFASGRCVAYKGKVYFLGMTYDEERILSYAEGYKTADYGDRPVKDPTPDEKVNITLKAQNDGNVIPGKKIKITVTTEPEIPAGRIRWYSDDATVASVDQKGVVTGKRPGTAYVYASVDSPLGYRKACRVYVYEPATSISLSSKNIKIAEGCRVDLKANAEPLGVASQDLSWEVKEPSKCSGLIKVVQKEKKNGVPTKLQIFAGALPDKINSAKATVTFKTDDGSRKTAKLTVTVYRATEGISIKQGSKDVTDKVISMVENKNTGLKAVISPGKTASKTLEWWSTDTSVATVRNGRVSATGHGTARIYAQATDGTEKRAYCTVSVNAPVRKAELNTSGTIYLGKNTDYDVSINRVTPEGCGDYTVSWNSSRPDIVSVSANEENADLAEISVKSNGTAKVWAVITNLDKGGRQTVKTNVLTIRSVQSSASANSLRIRSGRKDITGNTNVSDNTAARVKRGKTLSLTAMAYDKSGTKVKKPYYVWTTSDPTIATVANGKVKAYREGAVDIGVHMVPPAGSNDWKSAYCRIYVYEPVTKIGIYNDDDDNKVEVKRITLASTSTSGDAVHFICTCETKEKAGKDNIREEKPIQWTSSNPAVLECYIDQDGRQMFLPKKTGTAWITAKVLDGSNKSARCRVNVIGSVREVSIGFKGKLPRGVSQNDTKDFKGSKDLHGLKRGDTFTIKPVITPATAADKRVVYISSDPNVATVDSSGRVKIKKAIENDIYITVMTADAGLSVDCILKKD